MEIRQRRQANSFLLRQEGITRRLDTLLRMEAILCSNLTEAGIIRLFLFHRVVYMTRVCMGSSLMVRQGLRERHIRRMIPGMYSCDGDFRYILSCWLYAVTRLLSLQPLRPCLHYILSRCTPNMDTTHSNRGLGNTTMPLSSKRTRVLQLLHIQLAHHLFLDLLSLAHFFYRVDNVYVMFSFVL